MAGANGYYITSLTEDWCTVAVAVAAAAVDSAFGIAVAADQAGCRLPHSCFVAARR